MAFEPGEKERLLSSMMDSRRKGQTTEVTLRFQGQTPEADRIKEANKRLATEIDRLEAAVMELWLGTANAAAAELRRVNTGLDAAIADIKKKTKIGVTGVQAPGYVD